MADSGSTRRFTIAAMAIAALHTAAVARLVGYGPLLHGAALASVDWSHHTANAWTARTMWLGTGRLAGFCPSSMGGYVFGTADSVSNRLGELLTAVLPISPPTQAFAFVVLGLLALAPLAAAAASNQLGCSPRETVATLVIAIALIWRAADSARAWLDFGLYGFLFALAMAPLAVAASLAAQHSWARAVLAAVTTALGWTAHLLFPVLIAPGILFGLAAATQGQRRLPLRAILAVVSGAALAWPIWQPLAAFRHHLRLAPQHFHVDARAAVGHEVASLFAAIWLLGALGLWRVWRTRRSYAALGLGAGAGALLLACVLSPPAFAQLQPARLVDAVSFLLAPGVAVGTATLARSIPRPWLAWLATGLLVAHPLGNLCQQLVGLRTPLLAWSESFPDPRIDADVAALPALIRREVPPDTRVLIEEGPTWPPGRPLIWGPILFPALLPHLIGMEVVGGPLPDSRLREAHVGFLDGVLFGQPVETLTTAQFEQLLDVWNIGLVVAWSRQSTAALAEQPALLGTTHRRFTLFRVRAPRGCFALAQPGLPCPAVARAAPGSIRVQPKKSGEIVLAWHWNEGLEASSGTLRPYPLDGDPLGLIALDAPVADAEIKITQR